MFVSKKQTRDFIQEESKDAGGNHILFKAMTSFQIKEPIHTHQLGELCIHPPPTHTHTHFEGQSSKMHTLFSNWSPHLVLIF